MTTRSHPVFAHLFVESFKDALTKRAPSMRVGVKWAHHGDEEQHNSVSVEVIRWQLSGSGRHSADTQRLAVAGMARKLAIHLTEECNEPEGVLFLFDVHGKWFQVSETETATQLCVMMRK